MYFSLEKLSKLTINKLTLVLNKWGLFVGVLKIAIWFQGFGDNFSDENFTSKTFCPPKLILSFQVRHLSHNTIVDFSRVIKTDVYVTHRESLKCESGIQIVMTKSRRIMPDL